MKIDNNLSLAIRANNYRFNNMNHFGANITFKSGINDKQASLRELLKNTLNNYNTTIKDNSNQASLYKIIQHNKCLIYLEQEFNKLNEILFNSSNSKDFEKISKFLTKMSELGENKGFGRIVGYDSIKVLLTNNFIFDSMLKDKISTKTRVPDAVLFFGPNSNGKSTFALALAEQSLANLKVIDAAANTEMKCEQLLQTALTSAKENYLKSGLEKQRTIILINEAEFMTGENFVQIIENCSEKFNTTLFLTTNHPEYINKKLLDPKITPIKVGIAPPNKEIIRALFNKKISTNIQNVDEIVHLLLKDNDNKYSNGMICELIAHAYLDKSDDIVNNVKKLIERKDFRPNINREEIDLFNKYKILFGAY